MDDLLFESKFRFSKPSFSVLRSHRVCYLWCNYVPDCVIPVILSNHSLSLFNNGLAFLFEKYKARLTLNLIMIRSGLELATSVGVCWVVV